MRVGRLSMQLQTVSGDAVEMGGSFLCDAHARRIADCNHNLYAPEIERCESKISKRKGCRSSGPSLLVRLPNPIA